MSDEIIQFSTTADWVIYDPNLLKFRNRCNQACNSRSQIKLDATERTLSTK